MKLLIDPDGMERETFEVLKRDLLDAKNIYPKLQIGVTEGYHGDQYVHVEIPNENVRTLFFVLGDFAHGLEEKLDPKG